MLVEIDAVWLIFGIFAAILIILILHLIHNKIEEKKIREAIDKYGKEDY